MSAAYRIGKKLIGEGVDLAERLAAKAAAKELRVPADLAVRPGVPLVPADIGKKAVLPKVDTGEGTLMGAYKHKVEMVPVSWLEKMRGNELRHSEEKMRKLAEDIAENGLNNPLIISVGKNDRTAILGEGNHRLEIAKRLGYTHVPARVMVGDAGGSTIGFERTDLIPEANKYFSADARPSEVFSTLQEGGDPTSLAVKPRERVRTSEDDALDALLEEFAAHQRERELADLVVKKAKGGGVWARKEGQNPEGGLNAKGRASLKAQGHDIKPPVSAKLAAKSPKAAARRKSFCARMSGMPGPMKDEKGRPTRKALSLRKWDC